MSILFQSIEQGLYQSQSLLSIATLDFNDLLSKQSLQSFTRIAVWLFAVWPLLIFTSGALRKTLGRRVTPQTGMLVAKSLSYIGGLIIFFAVLREAGFKISTLLGAAGVAGIAFGFAAQTSLSNLISGIFLMLERPFQVGDLLEIAGTRGFVVSIDLLSVKMRTGDNKLVRLPNEAVIKGQVINYTHYPIRRLDLNIGVAYKEDIRSVMKILREVADENPYCLDEPTPVVTISGLGDSSVNFRVGAWFVREDFINLKDSLVPDIKERFDAEGIEIPFPNRTITIRKEDAEADTKADFPMSFEVSDEAPTT